MPFSRQLGHRRVLLVEDNPGDVDLTRRAFRDFPVTFEIARNGEVAIDRLFDQSKPLPDLIMLDLNLPRVTGWEVLEQVKRSPLTRAIPIVILTSSEAEEDMHRSYDLHANTYLVKPVTPSSFRELAGDFDAFWFGRAQIPRVAR